LITPDTVFVKSAAGSCEEEAGVILFMPRYPTFAGRLAGKLLRKSSHIKVKLDALGSAVWKLIDGTRSIHQIGEEIQETFGNEAEPLYPRLVEFLNILLRNKFIRLVQACEVENVEQGRV
jgi:hypothetical protein